MLGEQELLDLKKDIEEGKENLSKLQGKKEQMLETMAKEYGVKSIAAAEKRIKELEKKIEQHDTDIATATEKLEGLLPE